MNLQHITVEIECIVLWHFGAEVACDEDLGDDIWPLLPIICKKFDLEITDQQAEKLTTIDLLAGHINERLNGDRV